MPRAYGFLFAGVFPSQSGALRTPMQIVYLVAGSDRPQNSHWWVIDSSLIRRSEGLLCCMSLCILFTYMICFCMGYFYINFSFPYGNWGVGSHFSRVIIGKPAPSHPSIRPFIWICESWLSFSSLIWRSPSFLLPFSAHLLPQSVVPGGFLEK